MTNTQQHDDVRSRNEPFVARTATRIWCEQASADNPYIAAGARCHGYDLYELMDKRSFVDVFYLLFRGELPSPEQAELLQALMIALINPGPRHPATRAAMNAGVGKSSPVHILPIASAVLGGDYLGGGGVEESIRFLRKNQKTALPALVDQAVAARADSLAAGGEELLPGFGSVYGGVDAMAAEIAGRLAQLAGAGRALRWGCELAEGLRAQGAGWLLPGVAAAVFADLGFQPRAGGALFQLLGAPGLLAHGLELANKPITAMPFVTDENYVIER